MDGISFLLVRSPEAPNMTTKWGSGTFILSMVEIKYFLSVSYEIQTRLFI